MLLFFYQTEKCYTNVSVKDRRLNKCSLLPKFSPSVVDTVVDPFVDSFVVDTVVVNDETVVVVSACIKR